MIFHMRTKLLVHIQGNMIIALHRYSYCIYTVSGIDGYESFFIED